MKSLFFVMCYIALPMWSNDVSDAELESFKWEGHPGFYMYRESSIPISNSSTLKDYLQADKFLQKNNLVESWNRISPHSRSSMVASEIACEILRKTLDSNNHLELAYDILNSLLIENCDGPRRKQSLGSCACHLRYSKALLPFAEEYVALKNSRLEEVFPLVSKDIKVLMEETRALKAQISELNDQIVKLAQPQKITESPESLSTKFCCFPPLFDLLDICWREGKKLGAKEV